MERQEMAGRENRRQDNEAIERRRDKEANGKTTTQMKR